MHIASSTLSAPNDLDEWALNLDEWALNLDDFRGPRQLRPYSHFGPDEIMVSPVLSALLQELTRSLSSSFW